MQRKIGYLLIHGFGGNIAEIEPLNQYFNKDGFITRCPKLKGHTGIRRDLGKSNYHQWIESAEKDFVELQNQCEQVVIIGFSMGGLIAVNLALKYKVAALVLLNMPIYYWDFKRITLNILQDFKTRQWVHVKEYYRQSINKPIKSLVNFIMLLSKTKSLLKYIEQPVFIAQSLKDAVVEYKSANYIYNHIASNKKELKYYKDAEHRICLHENVVGDLFYDIKKFSMENINF